MKELLGSMEADVGSVNIEKVKVTSNSAIALVTGVKKQDYEKMNFMDVRSFWYHLVMVNIRYIFHITGGIHNP